jgi:hypothetical protein
MSLTVVTETHERYIKLIVTGQWELMEMLKLIGVIQTMNQSEQRDRVLIDLRGVEGERPDADRVWAGKQAALALRHGVKVAIVDHAERINKVAENTAVARGAQLFVAPTEQEAVAWLAS